MDTLNILLLLLVHLDFSSKRKVPQVGVPFLEDNRLGNTDVEKFLLGIPILLPQEIENPVEKWGCEVLLLHKIK